MNSFDMLVIGSGSGLEVSSEAAERGLSVAPLFWCTYGHDAEKRQALVRAKCVARKGGE